jgi:hypothetical protein
MKELFFLDRVTKTRQLQVSNIFFHRSLLVFNH